MKNQRVQLGFWRRLLERPQQVWIRKALFQVHLWAGILVGLYIIAIGVSGSILVFKEELFPRPPVDVGEVDTRACTPEGLYSTVEKVNAAYPGWEAFLTACPSEFNPLYLTTIRKKLPKEKTQDTPGPRQRAMRREQLAVYSHPHTGEVLGHTNREESWVNWMEDFHYNLVAGRTGRLWNGIGAAVLLALTITGVVLWWPGLRSWKRALVMDFRRSWKRINWDLHNVVGFWTVAFTLMWALTGMYFTWPKLFTEPIGWISPVVSANYPGEQIRKAPRPTITEDSKLDVVAVLREAQRLSPDGVLEGYFYGFGKRPIFTVYMARGRVGDYANTDFLYFDQLTGTHLHTWHRGKNQTLGDWLVWLVVPIHFGTSWGPAVKWLWFVLGLVLPLLTITGFLMYWNRYLGKRWKALKARSRATVAAASS